MDSLIENDHLSSVGTSHEVASGLAFSGETLMCVVVAMVVLRLELQRRAGTGPDIGSRRDASRYAQNCKRFLKECVPEAASLIACLTLAAALRARGDVVPPSDAEAWEQIKAQWPLLLTADTLLSLQAMLRLVVLLSMVFRAGIGGQPLALSEETSALWMGANMARLLLLSRTAAYMLDGPLGGMLPVACEIAVMPILLVLSRGTIRRAPATLALIIAAASCFAFRNHLALCGDVMSDALFTLAHSLDLLAGCTYLVRTVLIERCTRDVSVGFTHLLMPIQQGVAAYYFWQAFSYVPELVGAGLPFEVLQLGNTVCFGAYLAASALYVAECYDARAGQGNSLTA